MRTHMIRHTKTTVTKPKGKVSQPGQFEAARQGSQLVFVLLNSLGSN
jgi:hypothetical protein